MLMGLAVSTALPTIDFPSTPSVNSLKSILSESFCDSMKCSRLSGGARAERRRGILLEHVHAAGVGARDLAGLLEDEREQLADVALRRQRPRRRDELRHLVAEPVGYLPELVPLHRSSYQSWEPWEGSHTLRCSLQPAKPASARATLSRYLARSRSILAAS